MNIKNFFKLFFDFINCYTYYENDNENENGNGNGNGNENENEHYDYNFYNILYDDDINKSLVYKKYI